MKKFRIDVAAVLMLAAGTATAGAVWHNAGCNRNADGSGTCEGTFQGFRDHSYQKSYVYFTESSDGSRSFSANFQNPYTGQYSWGSCVPNASVAAMWPKAMTFNGYFSINFDANGVCTQLTLRNGSTYYAGP